MVVIRPPRFDLAPRNFDRQELIGVETFVSQLAVEGHPMKPLPTGFPGRMSTPARNKTYRDEVLLAPRNPALSIQRDGEPLYRNIDC